MSGAKRISVDQGAWNRAQKAARRLADVQRDLPRMLEEVRRQHQADLDRALGAVDRRQQQVENDLGGLSRYTRDLEEQTNRRLREQASRLKRLRVETGEEAQRLRRELDEERAARKLLDDKVAELESGRDRASERALATFSDAVKMSETVGSMPHEKFAPGRLDRIRQRLVHISDTLEGQEAAYSLGRIQEAYFDLSDLRAEVQLAEREWCLAQAEALGALRLAAERAAARADLPVPGEDGEPPADVRLVVDFWTDGGLTALREEIAALIREAEVLDGPLTVEDLRLAVREHAPRYEAELDALVERAAARLYASQLRAETADHIIDALEDQGYELVEETYEGEDYREAHYSKVRHLGDGSEVVVEVAPEGDTGLAIRLLSYGDGRSETRRVQRAENLLAALRRQGVPVGSPTDLGVEPSPGEGDFQLIRGRRRRLD
ncbi:coiled-coil domain-containing protein [Actinocorallia populi]|uniref:hypothetical protein n=1 Tax=Actinocorallia populi TaxID=2079200 RepID=UPI000D093B8F|nr:hypothetical protein [Actinocorallia populi]